MHLIKKIILFLIVIIIVFVANIFISTGYFRTIENNFDGEIVKKIKLPGAEDITVSSIDSFALVSSTNRGSIPATREDSGGLYFMNLKSGDYKVKLLTSNFKKPFAPHGISMFKKDSTYKVAAISHTASGHSIEIFTLKGKELTFEKYYACYLPHPQVLLSRPQSFFISFSK